MEHETRTFPIDAIHLDIRALRLDFITGDRVVAELLLRPDGMQLHVAGREAATATELALDDTPSVEAAKNPTLTIAGKIKSAIKAGRPDASGKPTVFARLAVHEADRTEARLVLATFHRHTTDIARRLSVDDPIVAQGYLHRQPAGSSRLDTFSVFNLLRYPGMVERPTPTSPTGWEQFFGVPRKEGGPR